MSAKKRLRAVFAGKDLLTDAADCWTYGYDNSRQQALPQAVCFAHDVDQIVELVRICREFHLPLVTRGRGTGTTGATVPLRGGIVLSMERYRNRLDIDPANRLAHISPGFKIGRASCRERV